MISEIRRSTKKFMALPQMIRVSFQHHGEEPRKLSFQTDQRTQNSNILMHQPLLKELERILETRRLMKKSMASPQLTRASFQLLGEEPRKLSFQTDQRTQNSNILTPQPSPRSKIL